MEFHWQKSLEAGLSGKIGLSNVTKKHEIEQVFPDYILGAAARISS